MADRTRIEWTEATWNPVTGCTKVSAGCDHCYAETLAERFRGTPGHYYEQGFDVILRPDKLDLPLRWTRPRRIFVNSMSDLFHDEVPDTFILRVFSVMQRAPNHTFQVLTKRHARMRSLLRSLDFRAAVGFEAGHVDWPLPNVWLGVSAENQQWADIRIPALLDTPAAVRWVSAEPLLGPINFRTGRYAMPPDGAVTGTTLDGIDWVVAGGESGRGARPMHPDWARSLRDQCDAADVPFLFKQWGEWAPAPWRVPLDDQGQLGDHDLAEVKAHAEQIGASHGLAWDGHLVELSHKPWSIERSPTAPDRFTGVRRAGKKAAGRTLDGELHDGYPAEVPG